MSCGLGLGLRVYCRAFVVQRRLHFQSDLVLFLLLCRHLMTFLLSLVQAFSSLRPAFGLACPHVVKVISTFEGRWIAYIQLVGPVRIRLLFGCLTDLLFRLRTVRVLFLSRTEWSPGG